MQHDLQHLRELDVVALRTAMPSSNLPAGQTGTVLFVHPDAEAVEVEFILKPRRSVVLTVPTSVLLKLQGISVSAAV
jgi:hypothetical protein